jgi:hypothetical protein
MPRPWSLLAVSLLLLGAEPALAATKAAEATANYKIAVPADLPSRLAAAQQRSEGRGDPFAGMEDRLAAEQARARTAIRQAEPVYTTPQAMFIVGSRR